MTRMTPRRWLAGALLVGALVRLPGVAWGVNWPDGFTVHHPDERTHIAIADSIISPHAPQNPPPYPKAMGAFAAAPFLLRNLVTGQLDGPRVHIPWTVTAGRLVSVAFGVGAILLVFALGRDALGSRRAGLFAAWLLALGGLHVTQSHFFLADVPAATWTLVAVWLAWRDVTGRTPRTPWHLRGAAFAAGAALAFKLFPFAVPAVAYAAWSRPSRGRRTIEAAAMAAAALVVCTLGFESPATLRAALQSGVNAPFVYSRAWGAVLYALQLPSVLSLPFLAIGVAGTASLVPRLLASAAVTRRHAALVLGGAPVLAILFIVFKLDPFPRHLVVLIPWAALAGGWALDRLCARLGSRANWVLVPLFVWMTAFVVDGERFFLTDPRNDALRWVHARVVPGATLHWTRHGTPRGYAPSAGPGEALPDVLVLEMYEANNFLSGLGWRNSYPTDPAEVFDGGSAARVRAVQGLFQGTAPYALVARFGVPYLMPEYRWTEAWLGDRARSYITEVVIFERRP